MYLYISASCLHSERNSACAGNILMAFTTPVLACTPRYVHPLEPSPAIAFFLAWSTHVNPQFPALIIAVALASGFGDSAGDGAVSDIALRAKAVLRQVLPYS